MPWGKSQIFQVPKGVFSMGLSMGRGFQKTLGYKVTNPKKDEYMQFIINNTSINLYTT
jgi:hypothetical protein